MKHISKYLTPTGSEMVDKCVGYLCCLLQGHSSRHIYIYTVYMNIYIYIFLLSLFYLKSSQMEDAHIPKLLIMNNNNKNKYMSFIYLIYNSAMFFL